MARQPEILIEKLFRMEYEKLRAIATSVVHDPDLAEDCVQKAFCIALIKEKELYDHPNPHGWIIQTVRYIAMDERKKRDRHHKRNLSLERDAADVRSAECVEDAPDCTEILAQIRGALKPQDYSLLMRAVEKDSGGEEIAAEFGITVNTYYKRMERIRKRVKKILDPDRKNKIIFLFLCQVLGFLAIYK